MPNPAPTLLAKPYSLIAKRGLFATKHLWVTPHEEEEHYPSGDWVLQGKGGEGLEQWVKQVTVYGYTAKPIYSYTAAPLNCFNFMMSHLPNMQSTRSWANPDHPVRLA